MGILQIVVVLAIALLLMIPMGTYLYKVISGKKSFVDPVMDRVDGFIFKVTGIKREEMSWKKYVLALIFTNAVMVLFVYIIFRIQGSLFLNPNGAKGMEPSLTFNTAISFITNTNLQDYAGETALSYLSQMICITFLMFTSAATGFAAASAFMRGITGKTKTVGNFFVDLVRITTRVLLPLSIIVTLVLVWQGVPQTLAHTQTVTTIEGSYQDIPMGPVAALEAIKHIGTNTVDKCY